MERNRHALDLADWGLVRPALAACSSDQRNRRTPGAAKHGKLVLRLRERRTHRLHLAARGRDFGGFADRSCKLQAPVEPVPNLRDQAHGGFFPSRAALSPGVGSSPAWMVIRP